jgi:hypothetical protein
MRVVERVIASTLPLVVLPSNRVFVVPGKAILCLDEEAPFRWAARVTRSLPATEVNHGETVPVQNPYRPAGELSSR